MGKPREFSRMLSISDGYWGFVHQKRFYRFAYATLTIFAIFALVAGFFKVGDGTRFASDYWKQKLHLTNAEMEENEQLLAWIYVFYPTPVAVAWFIVYFGKFFFCWRIKRLRKARNYKYNLLLATIVMAIGYSLIFWYFLKLDVIDGPKMRVALITAVCEFSLIGIEVFDQHQVRVARHRRKKLLVRQQEMEHEIRNQIRAGDGEPLGPQTGTQHPGGLV
ncbi:hypothetical protein Poli38472_006876 [Pythium oligandrum]|uniref:Uncharacterized protein n=1 Tax=Pythium oligandrum TaxID=41045 RepID=A0A8K1FC70_PYTOL|nr:hypothetical protein Poli38472_006876 [Pythium oligandrum]|eukprot:TMW56866.1 hypothetical protein Poli38472_006876 [Pythium oligandrum]